MFDRLATPHISNDKQSLQQHTFEKYEKNSVCRMQTSLTRNSSRLSYNVCDVTKRLNNG